MAFKNLSKHRKENAQCQLIIESIHNKTKHEGYFIKDDILMYKMESGKPKIYLPRYLINLVFAYYHTSLVGYLEIATKLVNISVGLICIML